MNECFIAWRCGAGGLAGENRDRAGFGGWVRMGDDVVLDGDDMYCLNAFLGSDCVVISLLFFCFLGCEGRRFGESRFFTACET